MSKLIAFRASDELRESINKAAGEQDRSVSWIITNALEQVLKSDVGQDRGVAENRVMPKSRRAADTSVGGTGTPEATVLRAGANPASPTRNTTASGSQSPKISSAAPVGELTYGELED